VSNAVLKANMFR